MSDISSKLSSAPASAGTGFEHRAAGSCSVAKRMSENFDWVLNLRDFIYQLNVIKIQKQEILNLISGIYFKQEELGHQRFPYLRKINLFIKLKI